MKKALAILAALCLVSAVPVAAQSDDMSFFITSVGSLDGANLGGLAGADQLCEDLAYAVGAGNKVWRAYLSQMARGGQPAVNARDRIGAGPWVNYYGDVIAQDVTALHSPAANLSKSSILTERGSVVNGRGDTPNTHDILTGSNLDGTVYTGEGATACNNWTTNGAGSARVGHFDRTGGGENPTSWNSAHNSSGCSQANLRATGGNGYFFCFSAGDDPAQQEEEQQ
ncbi:MAG: hypothetical protein OEO79_00025 [Gemmatimonadota bacterium]|nr:hypothetical protein [Gemmatimonadota bacterium]